MALRFYLWVGDVCRDRKRILSKFSGETVNEFGRPREHSDGATFFGQPAHERCSQTRSNPGDDGYASPRFVSHIAFFSDAR
jgi:hypothetical protein